MTEQPAKRSKERVAYRPRPLLFADGRNEMCRACSNFEPPEACKVVEGEVSPAGWCVRFSRPSTEADHI